MRHAVLFSSFIPSTEVGESVADYWLSILRKYHHDSDIYVGINCGSSPTWERKLDSSELRIIKSFVTEDRVVDSDVSGYQAAMEAARRSGRSYDYYWFGHSKGATHSQFDYADMLRKQIEARFWSKRDHVENFCDINRFGVFGGFFCPMTRPDNQVVEKIKKLYRSELGIIGYWTPFSFFGLTGPSLCRFFDRVDDAFFSKKPNFRPWDEPTFF